MRTSTLAAFSFAVVLFSNNMSSATTITVQYTGTYTASWSGNYDPLGQFPKDVDGGPTEGTYSQRPFDLTFKFDSTLANPDSFTSSHLGNPYFGSVPIFASVGSAIFTSDLFSFTSGDIAASTDNTDGSTIQSAYGIHLGSFAAGANVFMNVSSPQIPGAILQPYTITSGLTGGGSVEYDYGDLFFGGGVVNFDLVPLTLQVSISPLADAVPEPATWVSMLLGFFGIGLLGHRRNKREPAPLARSAASAP